MTQFLLKSKKFQLLVIRMKLAFNDFDIKHKTNKIFSTNNNHSTHGTKLSPRPVIQTT